MQGMNPKITYVNISGTEIILTYKKFQELFKFKRATSQRELKKPKIKLKNRRGSGL